MTIKEKRKILNAYCDNAVDCKKCLLNRKNKWTVPCEFTDCPNFENSPESELDEALKIIHGVTDDPVNHPSHYNKGKIEVAVFIADQKLNFDRGNAVKYICRAGSKDPEKEIQDLEKAIWYINHEIKMLKGETENGNLG